MELMKAHNISAPTPLYVASGLLTYMEADGDGPAVDKQPIVHGCRLNALTETLAVDVVSVSFHTGATVVSLEGMRPP